MKKLIFILVFNASLFLSQASYSQWIQTGGPDGADVTCLSESRGVLYAGTMSQGAFRSTNHGSSWLKMGLQGNWVISFTSVGNTVFAIASDNPYLGQLMKTTNNGASWDTCAGLANVMCLAADNANVYAATNYEGVYVTTNSGASWANPNIGLPVWNVFRVAVSGGNVYAATFVNGVFRSTDNGTSWEYLGLDSVGINAMGVAGSEIFVAGREDYEARFFVSTNNGMNWSSHPQGFAGDTYGLASNGSHIFAVTDFIYRTSDKGITWEGVNPENLYFVRSIAAIGSDVFAGAEHFMRGVFRSTNNGTDWHPSSKGIMIPDISGLEASCGALFAGTMRGGVRCSSNMGQDWMSAGINMSLMILSFAANDQNVYAGTQWDQGGVFQTSDRGITWNMISGLDDNVYDILAVEATNEKIYASTKNFYSPGLYMTANNGASWRWMGNLQGSYLLYARGNDLIVADYYLGMQMTTNDGLQWINMNNGIPGNYVLSIFSKNSLIFASFAGAGVYVTTNDGQSWTPSGSGITDPNVTSFVAYEQKIFAGSSSGVFVTTNDGQSWSGISDDPENLNVSFLEVFEENLYAATRLDGVWRFPLEAPLPVELESFTANVLETKVRLEWVTAYEINNAGFEVERKMQNANAWTKIGFVKGSGTVNERTGYSFEDRNSVSGMYNYRLKQIDLNGNFVYLNLNSDVSIGLPKEFVLYQNYPNPFNPGTVIIYRLKDQCEVSLVIYDITGKQVRKLTSGIQEAGEYKIYFDANYLSGGTYSYKLKAGEFEAVRKMILLR